MTVYKNAVLAVETIQKVKQYSRTVRYLKCITSEFGQFLFKNNAFMPLGIRAILRSKRYRYSRIKRLNQTLTL